MLSMSAECSASSTPNGVVLDHDGSPRKAPRLKALPKVCADTGIMTLAEAQMVLSQLDEIRTRVLRAFPEADIGNGGHRRALQQPPLPGAVDVTHNEPEAMPVAYEHRVRDIVREEMRRWDSASKQIPGEHNDAVDNQFIRVPSGTCSRDCSPDGTRRTAKHHSAHAKAYSPHTPQRQLNSRAGASRTASAAPKAQHSRGVDGGFELKSTKPRSRRVRSSPTDGFDRSPSCTSRDGTPTPSTGGDYFSDSEFSTVVQASGEEGMQAADVGSLTDIPSTIHERPSQEFALSDRGTDGFRAGEDGEGEAGKGGDGDADKEGSDAGSDDLCEWEKVTHARTHRREKAI